VKEPKNERRLIMASNDNPHLACPYVECGSSDAFNWNDDGYGHCHSCSRSYPMKDMPQVFDWVKSEYPLKERRNPMDITIASYNNCVPDA
jgi:hypothetical protein